MTETEPKGVMERVAVLEAKVRLIALTLKGTIAVIVSAVVAYLINKS